MKRITVLFLGLVLIFNFSITPAIAASDADFKEATDFMVSKGFLKNEIIHTEKTDKGIKFSMKYLPYGEISYVTYMKVLDGVDLIITEGEKENTISYKNNGAIYIDGVKEQGV